MLLEINFSNDLRTKILLENLEEKIPCVFCAAGQDMEIKFQHIFPNEIVGKVNGLERRLLDERSPAGVGGIAHSLIFFRYQSIRIIRFFISPLFLPLRKFNLFMWYFFIRNFTKDVTYNI